MTLSWGELFERRREVRSRFGRLHQLPLTRRARDRIAPLLRDGCLLLDVGAGDRRLERRLRAECPRLRYLSVDSDRVERHDFARVSEVSEKADVVACLEVLEHLSWEEIPSFLREIRGRLREGGALVVSTPNVYHANEWLTDATHRTPLCYDMLAATLELVGFEVVAIHRGYNDPFLRRLLRRGVLGWLYRLLEMDPARQIVITARRAA